MELQAGNRTMKLTGHLTGFRFSLETLPEEDGVQYFRFVMRSEEPRVPSPISLSWREPAIDFHGYWDPGSSRDKGLRVDFSTPFSSKSTSLAPVYSFYNLTGKNRLTVALSDALTPLKLRAGVHEETVSVDCYTEFFTEPSPAITRYETVIRIDQRDIYYYDSLHDVSDWWAGLPGYEPSAVPDIARLPMYSTWYSFHQQLEPEAILRQCAISKDMGCEAVIVDDGWQTDNSERGYAYCGDWQVAPSRIPDMKSFVDSVHQAGMKFILWYSVPFVGIHSEAYARFKGKFINTYGNDGTYVLDPRFPEVREYLIGIYEKALREWDLDGFKLDFVDSFNLSEEWKDAAGEGRDYNSVPEAVDRLLTDVMARLKRIKADIMIEFRQQYIGPLMRKYGNMFRVADCPNNASQNRIGSLDLRLLSGSTAVHSDMMVWHSGDSERNVALQFIHALFSVPQVSVLLDEIPDGQRRTAAFWLRFWREHRELLMDGKLEPISPELLYPIVYAAADQHMLAAVYGDQVVRGCPSGTKRYTVINGTLQDRLVMEWNSSELAEVTVLNHSGETIRKELVRLEEGLLQLHVPPSGLAVIELK
ncbi:glycoside hydrolase family 36 protein [Paenibacillus dakarensis]|uniref:glycoside hydrolase family 36 protein n=1 Tax=Paenibacillus dakarensis TaxID=1527293 RepID=UPI0006D53252|nr:glycoside hydrolase family 36 protein [Paenibacillus dakarensis]